MRLRLLQVLLAVLVVVAIVSNLRRPRGIEPPPKRQLPPRTSGLPPSAAEGRAATRLRRSLFEYGEGAPERATTRTPLPTARLDTPTPAPTAPPVKLVGIVHAVEGLRAALAVDGEVVVGSRGEKVRGYTIVTIDEDAGVVLSGPDGETLELRPADTR